VLESEDGPLSVYQTDLVLIGVRLETYPYSCRACAMTSALALTCSCVFLTASSFPASSARKAVTRAFTSRHTSLKGTGFGGTSSSVPSCSSSRRSKDASASPPTLRTAVVRSDGRGCCAAEFDNEDCCGVSEPLVAEEAAASAVIVSVFRVVGALGGSDASLVIMVAIMGP
jgi:hypothetical protein